MTFFSLHYNVDIINISIKQSNLYSAIETSTHESINGWKRLNTQSKGSDSTNTKWFTQKYCHYAI